MVILENIDIDNDIDKAILQNIDIDKISNRFKFGISNRANCIPSAPTVKGGCQLQDVPALIVSLLCLPNDAFFERAEVFLAF